MQQPLTLEQKTTDDVLRQAQLITCKSTSFHQLHRVELSHTLVSDRGMIDVKNVHFKCMIWSKSRGNFTSEKNWCLCSDKCLAMQCWLLRAAAINLSLCIGTGLSRYWLQSLMNSYRKHNSWNFSEGTTFLFDSAKDCMLINMSSLTLFFHPSVASPSNLWLHAACSISLISPAMMRTLIVPLILLTLIFG